MKGRFKIRDVNEQGSFKTNAAQSPVLRQIFGDEEEETPPAAEAVTEAADDALQRARQREEERVAREAEEGREAERAAAAEAERKRKEDEEAAAAEAAERAAAEAKRRADEAAKEQGDRATLSPEQLAKIRRSGSRKAKYPRQSDGKEMVKVGFSATYAFDLKLQTFAALLVDDERNAWLMRTIEDAMAEQTPKLLERRQKLLELAEKGKKAES